MLHQEPDHLRRAVHDGEVNGAALVTVGHGHIRQLGAGLQHPASFGDVAGTDGIGQADDGDPIDVGLEPGPAFEPIAAGNDQLRVMQGESGGTGAIVVRLHFG